MNPSPSPLAAPAPVPAPRPSASMCLLYTVLRHGRGLTHEEAIRRVAAALGRIPAPAC